MKTYVPPHISSNLSASDIAAAIEAPGMEGILTITDLPQAPFDEIRGAFDDLKEHAEIGDRLNNAYQNNLVYKDSFAAGKGGVNVDMKRVLDLSPERLAQIEQNDPELLELANRGAGALPKTLLYWDNLRLTVAPKITRAVANAAGSEDVAADAALNYRMVDYHERGSTGPSTVAPRCGEHRDFGSFTLIFASHSGLEVHLQNQWCKLPALNAGSAYLLFGWCTQIRSNGRIPAVLHRVNDTEGVPRRNSAVLFSAPKLADTPLEPQVRSGEERLYISGIKAGQLRGKMARKWQKREGTLSDEGKILEEKEILATNMLSQDDVVKTVTMQTKNAIVGLV